jgi:putative ABC transport system permease protein
MTVPSAMLNDLVLAFRGLRRRPGFAVAAIATVALGIGASTAIFSVAYGIAFRPLPYPNPERLIRVYEAKADEALFEHEVSLAAFQAWRQGAPSLESAALFGSPRTRILAGSDSVPVGVLSVSPQFFDVLGIQPIIGAGFKPEQHYTARTAEDEAVISYDAWQRLFGRHPDVVGLTITVRGVGDDDAFRIVGVMPKGFLFGQPVDIWQPTQLVPSPMRAGYLSYRADHVIARLRPAASVANVREELETVAARLARDFPTHSARWTVTVVSLRDATIGTFGRASWLLIAAVAVVLLVTCVNVGGLLVARAIARERETAIRMALGAGSWRLLRLWLTEAAVIAVSGGSLGLLLAVWGIDALRAVSPPGIPRLETIAVDLPALLVATTSTLLALLFFAIVPGRSPRRHLVDDLRARSSSAGVGRRGPRHTLTLAQCAGAATLLVLSLVLTRSFMKLMAVDLGWDPERVVTMRVAPSIPRVPRPWHLFVDWSDRLLPSLEQTSGVDRAAVTSQVPLMPPEAYSFTVARGRGKGTSDGALWTGVQHSVTDGYFDTMNIRLVNGRIFGRADRFTPAQLTGDAPRDHGVAVVTETTARMLWPGRSAVGQALWVPTIDSIPWFEVIGVVEDIRFYSIAEAPVAHVFFPWTQYPTGSPRLIVRGAASIATIREVVGAISPGTYVEQIASLDSLVSRSTAQPRFTSRLILSFGLLALLLAAVGIYGTLSYVVGARTREIGIRMALGACRGAIILAVVRDGVLPAICGSVIGLAAALVLIPTFRALLFGIEPVDPLSFGVSAISVVLVAHAAAIGPALRASRVDPAVALRRE